MTDNTEPTIDEQIDNIVLKPTYWKYDDYQKTKQAIKALIANQVREARIDELNKVLEVKQYADENDRIDNYLKNSLTELQSKENK